jgi:hypothetical protein
MYMGNVGLFFSTDQKIVLVELTQDWRHVTFLKKASPCSNLSKIRSLLMRCRLAQVDMGEACKELV